MTPELQELTSLRTIVLFGAALTMTLLVSIARVMRERSAQRREGEPLTTFAEGAADVLYGSLAAMTMLLIQDAVKPLPIKAGIGLAMWIGSIGPAAWDFVTAVVQGKYSLVKKQEGP